jgi:hypothetical protein
VRSRKKEEKTTDNLAMLDMFRLLNTDKDGFLIF